MLMATLTFLSHSLSQQPMTSYFPQSLALTQLLPSFSLNTQGIQEKAPTHPPNYSSLFFHPLQAPKASGPRSIHWLDPPPSKPPLPCMYLLYTNHAHTFRTHQIAAFRDHDAVDFNEKWNITYKVPGNNKMVNMKWTIKNSTSKWKSLPHICLHCILSLL